MIFYCPTFIKWHMLETERESPGCVWKMQPPPFSLLKNNVTPSSCLALLYLTTEENASAIVIANIEDY